ncbi:MAG: hypothetical protein WCS42_16480, partial [Verrucomicrobiota bacterium]
CQLPTANCQLPTANCQLPTAISPRPIYTPAFHKFSPLQKPTSGPRRCLAVADAPCRSATVKNLKNKFDAFSFPLSEFRLPPSGFRFPISAFAFGFIARLFEKFPPLQPPLCVVVHLMSLEDIPCTLQMHQNFEKFI